MVPGVDEKELKETGINNRDIEILSNTSEIQAVKNNKLEICQATFYKSGELEISENLKIRMDSQGMAMVKFRENKIDELTVADPSRKLSRILITIPGIYQSKGNDFKTFPNNNQNNTFIVVDLPQGVYAGKSVNIRL